MFQRERALFQAEEWGRRRQPAAAAAVDLHGSAPP